MSLGQTLWNLFMLFTSTQLLILFFTLVVVLVLPFGVTFGLLVVLSYVCWILVWDLDLETLVKNVSFPTFSRAERNQSYTDAMQEVEKIKGLISKSFIHSWTSMLELDEDTIRKVSDAVDSALDHLLSLITNRRVDVFSFISDLIYGAHLHLVCYNKAKVDPMPRKQPRDYDAKVAAQTRFLEAARAEWDANYTHHQSDFFRVVSSHILHKFLPIEELSPLALEALTAIISEHVFVELVAYLSEQENLLKLVIRVLSDDHQEALSRAEAVCVKQEVTPPCEEESEPVVFSLVEEEKTDTTLVAGVMEESSSDGESNHFVSDELMNYFKIAPSGASASTSSLPAMVLKPAMTRPNQSEQTSVDVKPLALPATATPITPEENQSVDSGISVTTANELCVKFRFLEIPNTVTRTERLGTGKYTLYEIKYQGVYPNESGEGTYVKQLNVFRRYREFINLRARLLKCAKYQKALKSVQGPSWWHTVSLSSRTSQEVEKRRKELQRFVQGLLWQPMIHKSKDLEEFLAYNGGAEIEFVQEKIEFIPPAARLDKVVIKTFSDVFDKVTDKLSYQPPHGCPEGKRNSDGSDFKKGKLTEQTGSDIDTVMVFSALTKLQSDLIPIQSHPEYTMGPSEEEVTHIEPEDSSSTRQLADAIFQLLLVLLQDHMDGSKNRKIVSTVRSFLLPYLTHWLRNKIAVYSAPSEVRRLLNLFKHAIWPEEEEEEKKYELQKLKDVALQCVLDEIPSPVTAVMESQIRRLVQDVFEATECTQVNEQLCFTEVSQLVKSSLSVLL